MSNENGITLQRWHDSPADVRHGDLTGTIRARQIAEKQANDLAAEREAQAAQDAADAAGAAEDIETVIDLSSQAAREAYARQAQWSDADGSLG